MHLSIRNITLLVLMLATASLAIAMRPTHKIVDQGPKVDLEAMIPHEFGEWREEKQASAQIIDPQQKEMLEKLYTQTLSRTYANASGNRVMLSIAYGEDQRDAVQLHYPEVCYPAQGFEVARKTRGVLKTRSGPINVSRLITSLGQRLEPVTYWTTVGNTVVLGGFDKKLAEMHYGLGGNIADGLLFRVSSIDENSERAFELQQTFVSQLLSEVGLESRKRLAGLTN